MKQSGMTAKSVLMIMALAVACSAQTAAPAKPAKAAPSKSKAAAAAKPMKSTKKAAAMPASHKNTVHKSTAHKQAGSQAAAAPQAVAPELTAAAAMSRKRDPFVNPIQAVREGRNANCSGGKRCLAVNEIVLRGVVKSVNGMIAVVENAAQRTYFLHENDAIYNGVVQKITPDSVVFKEHYTDNLGRDQVREVVKNVNAPAV
jgi:hypothetical protein